MGNGKIDHKTFTLKKIENLWEKENNHCTLLVTETFGLCNENKAFFLQFSKLFIYTINAHSFFVFLSWISKTDFVLKLITLSLQNLINPRANYSVSKMTSTMSEPKEDKSGSIKKALFFLFIALVCENFSLKQLQPLSLTFLPFPHLCFFISSFGWVEQSKTDCEKCMIWGF